MIGRAEDTSVRLTWVMSYAATRDLVPVARSAARAVMNAFGVDRNERGGEREGAMLDLSSTTGPSRSQTAAGPKRPGTTMANHRSQVTMRMYP